MTLSCLVRTRDVMIPVFFLELEYELELLHKKVELEPCRINSLLEPVPGEELVLILELVPSIQPQDQHSINF